MLKKIVLFFQKKSHVNSVLDFNDKVIFTDREKDILACIVNGRTSKKCIATTLNISPKTVAFHNQNILKKINISSWEYIPQWLDDHNMTESLRARFVTLYDDIKKNENTAEEKRLLLFIKNWKIILILMILPFLGFYYAPTLFFKRQNEIIQEILPKYCLERARLLKVITQKMNQTDPHKIPTVCIIGMGGIGKTTLSKLWVEDFLKHHPKTFVGMIHSETAISRQLSLEELSTDLAKTTKQKSEMSEIEHTQCQKEKKRLQFIKDALLNEERWILIFDNVESYADIYDLLPKNPQHWGNGYILITTRNAHFEKTEFFDTNNILFLDELNIDESVDLFIKLRYPGKSVISPDEEKRIKDFLKDFPPFPLDISVAARHMNYNNLSIEEYKKQIDLKSDTFHEVEKDILTEITSYTQTRYGILSLSFKQVLDKNPKFYMLLKVLTLLDSQNIPLHILYQVEDQLVCQSFLNEMRKHSLIMNEKKQEDYFVFSVHRSTQNFSKAYVNQQFSAEENKKILDSVVTR